METGVNTADTAGCGILFFQPQQEATINEHMPRHPCAAARGTRLWPLSRRLYPKQFMDLGGHTLFRDTLRRVMDLECALPPLILCNEEQRFLAAAQLQALAQEQGRESTGKIILEPEGRNTAPAIAVAAFAALTGEFCSSPCFNPVGSQGEEPLLLVLPSDHVLHDVANFAGAVAEAAVCAEQGYLVTFGVRPAGPETGYGWLRRRSPERRLWGSALCRKTVPRRCPSHVCRRRLLLEQRHVPVPSLAISERTGHLGP